MQTKMKLRDQFRLRKDLRLAVYEEAKKAGCKCMNTWINQQIAKQLASLNRH